MADVWEYRLVTWSHAVSADEYAAQLNAEGAAGFEAFFVVEHANGTIVTMMKRRGRMTQ